MIACTGISISLILAKTKSKEQNDSQSHDMIMMMMIKLMTISCDAPGLARILYSLENTTICPEIHISQPVNFADYFSRELPAQIFFRPGS